MKHYLSIRTIRLLKSFSQKLATIGEKLCFCELRFDGLMFPVWLFNNFLL